MGRMRLKICIWTRLVAHMRSEKFYGPMVRDVKVGVRLSIPMHALDPSEVE